MKYRLLVLTHGEHERTLRTSLRSFYEHVTPHPDDYMLVRDGKGYLPGPNPDGQTWRHAVLDPPQGFCEATRAAWEAASLPGPEYVFWLEHDFVFLRPLDLRELAAVLDEHPRLCQMHMIRKPVNSREKRAGGIVELYPSDYERRIGWMEHLLYFTTNPSLMRRSFMVENPWIVFDSECEGRYSAELRGRGFTTGAWGDGEPWVEHIGVRDGFGY